MRPPDDDGVILLADLPARHIVSDRESMDVSLAFVGAFEHDNLLGCRSKNRSSRECAGLRGKRDDTVSQRRKTGAVRERKFYTRDNRPTRARNSGTRQ